MAGRGELDPHSPPNEKAAVKNIRHSCQALGWLPSCTATDRLAGEGPRGEEAASLA